MKGVAVLTILALGCSVGVLGTSWQSAELCSYAFPELQVTYNSLVTCDAALSPAVVESFPTVTFSTGAAGFYLLVIVDLDPNGNAYLMYAAVVEKSGSFADLTVYTERLAYQLPPSPVGNHKQQFRLYDWDTSKTLILPDPAGPNFNLIDFETANTLSSSNRQAKFQEIVEYPVEA